MSAEASEQPRELAPAPDGSLPLVEIDLALLPLLREIWRGSPPEGVSVDANGAVSVASAAKWTIPAGSEAQRILAQFLGRVATLSLAPAPKSNARFALSVAGSFSQRPGVVAAGAATLFPPDAEFGDMTIACDRGVYLDSLLLQVAFPEGEAAEAGKTTARPAPVAAQVQAPSRARRPADGGTRDRIEDIESCVLSIADFAARLKRVAGVSVDPAADLLSVERESHEYVWLADLPGFFEALKAHPRHVVQMSVEGVVHGSPNIEAFFSLEHDAAWKNFGARPNYPVTLRLSDDFANARVGLRLVGRGSIAGLKIRFKIQREVEAQSRIDLRRAGDEAVDVGRLKVALIADPFTVEAFEGVVDKILIRPNDWRSLLKLDPPDILFVESAWLGNEGAWANRIVNNIEELEALVDWCKSAGVPTIFWNKEDPIHFHRFLKAARLFDLVYTTCAESIPGYESEGIRARVLPFSVNLATYNPIGGAQPRGRYGLFAGAYYAQKYPERGADLERMLDLAMRYGLRIFDRNAGSTGEEFAFPARFRSYIVGSANARQLDREYKRAGMAINVNTVKDSHSMFARRVFELAATGTPIVSNASPALRELFGDGLVASDDPAVIAREIELLFDDDRHWLQRRKSLMRTALMRHTVQDRVQTILRDLEVPLPRLGARVAVMVGDQAAAPASPEFPNLRIVDAAEAQTPLWQLMPAGAEYAALALNQARWDETTLKEFLRHQDYAQADVLGEAQGEPFRFGSSIRNSLLLIERQALLESDACLADLGSADLAERFRDLGLRIFGVERLNEPADETPAPLQVSTPPPPFATGWWEDGPWLVVHETPAGDVEGAMEQESRAHVRIGERHKLDAPPATSYVSPQEFPDGFALDFAFKTTAGRFEANLQVHFYRDGERLKPRLVAPDTRAFVRAPTGWTHAAVAVEAKGQGAFTFHVRLTERLRTAGDFVADSLGPCLNAETAWLCVSSVYPRPDNLYRNAFIHTRVKGYLAANHDVAVVTMAGAENVLTAYEYEGVRVFSGAGAALADLLQARTWSRVACHIVSREMLRILDERAPGVRKVVWVHAIEAERWYRRAFDVDLTAPGLEGRLRRLMSESDARNGAVREVYERSGRGPADCRVVFVSHWFRDYIGCVDVRPAPLDSRVIHNPIDTDVFAFRQKAPEDRFRWMSVRPFVSLKYGNDLTVAAILALSKAPWFAQTSISLFGRGALFEETVAPLRRFDNVRLENRFLTHAEIARGHAGHGLFLAPTRSDSQGVSLGEAMSSGLVPVSNDCQAISEFVPSDWGLLAPPEDAEGLAACIRRLVENPDLFCELSAKVSRHIQEKCGAAWIREQEIAALTDD